jgi:hypothetical protein
MKYPTLAIKTDPSTIVSPDVLVKVPNFERVAAENDRELISTRISGNFANKAFYLGQTFDWRLGLDSTGTLVLVPTNPVVSRI